MNCKQLETLVIPKSVRYLHGGLFSDCENIKNITLPFVGGSRDPEEEYSSLSYLFGGEVPYGIQTITITDCEHIPAAAFSGIEFERIVFPDGLKTIGDGAFRSCHISSGEIVIPDTVTSIGAGAFCEISFLTIVKLPANLESIGANAFSKTRINNIELPDNIKAIDNGAFAYCERLEKITIPSSVKTIGETAFYGCKMLEYVELSEGLEYIGDRAFEGTALWGLSLPSTIKHVGKDILYTWVSMASSKDGVLYRNGGSNLTMFLVGVHDRNKNQTTYTISPDTKVIYYNAFRDCNNLEEIVIPYGVTTICDNAFGFSLKKITVPVTVTSIGDGAFNLYPETEFVYEGTVAQWNAIEKNNPISRIYEDTVIVKCSDGNIVFSPETDAE